MDTVKKPRVRIKVNKQGGIHLRPAEGGLGLLIMSFTIKEADFNLFDFIADNKRFTTLHDNSLKAITL